MSDDTGAKVSGATVTLIGKTNNKTFQGVTANDGRLWSAVWMPATTPT